jgi:hypothetical protein
VASHRSLAKKASLGLGALGAHPFADDRIVMSMVPSQAPTTVRTMASPSPVPGKPWLEKVFAFGQTDSRIGDIDRSPSRSDPATTGELGVSARDVIGCAAHRHRQTHTGYGVGMYRAAGTRFLAVLPLARSDYHAPAATVRSLGRSFQRMWGCADAPAGASLTDVVWHHLATIARGALALWELAAARPRRAAERTCTGTQPNGMSQAHKLPSWQFGSAGWPCPIEPM